MEEQVVTLCAVTGRLLLDIPLSQMKRFQKEMLAWFYTAKPEIMNELATRKELGEELKNRILEAAKSFRDQWQEQGE